MRSTETYQRSVDQTTIPLLANADLDASLRHVDWIKHCHNEAMLCINIGQHLAPLSIRPPPQLFEPRQEHLEHTVWRQTFEQHAISWVTGED
jgi:hypothetical protein